MTAYKSFVRPVLFKLPVQPETLHDWASWILPLLPVHRSADIPNLALNVAGLRFPSPVGMAAGFDKDCRFFSSLYKFDFGSVEVGTITPVAQAGNSKPRIFRLEGDEAIVNRMGFPNDGIARALRRLQAAGRTPGPLGINIGANKDSSDKISDYVRGLRAVSDFADYVTINVSSPNTPGLRALETGQNLSRLLDALDREIAARAVPIFLKVSPDLSEEDIHATADVLMGSKISGVIVGNTTLERAHDLKEQRLAKEAGGLSGRPLGQKSGSALDLFYAALKGSLPIISVGGIFSAEDAYDRIKRGASLVQIYTSFIYEGTTVVRRMNRELSALVAADGFGSIQDAIGVQVLPAFHRTPRQAAVGSSRLARVVLA